MSNTKLKSAVSILATVALMTMLAGIASAKTIIVLILPAQDGKASTKIECRSFSMHRSQTALSSIESPLHYQHPVDAQHPVITFSIPVNTNTQSLINMAQHGTHADFKFEAFLLPAVQTGASTPTQVYYTIDLKNAMIVKIAMSTRSANAVPIETITLDYQQITETYAQGNKSAVDDWEQQAD